MKLPRLEGERIVLRQIDEADLDLLTAILVEPSVSEWWGEVRDRDETREELHLEQRSAWVIEIDGEIAGWLGLAEETDPDYLNAAFDIVLGSAHQDQGHGPDALRTAIRWLVAERGHHRFTIDPAVTNERAIAAYRSIGFTDVGVLRRYERDRKGVWRDNLLMDLMAEELLG